MRLTQLETELKCRLGYPYRWGRKQNNYWDKATNFIYQTPHFDQLLKHFEQAFAQHPEKQQWLDYTLNRWFNFWSAQALEKVFCHASAGVRPASDPQDSEKDFFITNIPFDHKTTVFPQRYPHSLHYAHQHPETLLQWLYEHQSKGKRLHHKNRLFVVLYDTYEQNHWQLKAYLTWLKALVDYYVHHFDSSRLFRLPGAYGEAPILADIIWAIR
ncbi:hypothetical protein [Microscilla marina]|uniref:Uncharacterized protein n=1 Tax=Microscilla marina ATCC 23134 TaxID=313606 RepID=A1ZCY4_MICM2|nr:hypothetical protein [Microscilla marina]EAY31523.1 conserved hypothetical protein [Microscilla marina ATCC 23134]